jgi:hypothetical protein
MKIKSLMMAAAAMIVSTAAMAQGHGWKSYSFVEAQGGVQLTSTDAPMDKLITPTAALSIGHYFTPVIGARLHVNAWQAKSGFENLGQYYKWNYFTPDLDLMVNLSNIFNRNQDRALNIILLGGVGLNYAWNNDELKDMNVAVQRIPLAWDKNHLSHNLRAGLRLETNMSKPLGISLEVNANSLDDRFNSKINDADDWQFTAMLGLNFRFGRKSACCGNCQRVIETPAPVIETPVETPPVVVETPPQPQPREIVTTEPVTLHREAFYAIRVSDNETPSAVMNDVAEFMRQYQDVHVTIVGYADRGTGNPRINMGYSKQRAEKFLADLISRYNVDASRITIDYKGDTVQPFPDDNDRNRCVIVDGTGIKEVRTIVYE